MTRTLPVLIGLAFVLIATVYVATGKRYRKLRAQYSESVPPGVAQELDAYELALLSGGKRRVGELALTHLYLDGFVRIARRGHPLLPSLARIRAAPGIAGRSEPGHPVPAGGLRVLDSTKPERPGIVMRRAADDQWATDALSRLREADLLLRPEELQGIRRARGAASLLHSVPASLLGALVIFGAGFGLMLLAATGLENTAGGLRSPAALGLPVVFMLWAWPMMRMHVRFGVRAVVIVTALIASFAILMDEIPLVVSVALLVFCVAWFVVYGIYTGTGGSLGPRTPRGDQLLVQAREQLAATEDQDAEPDLRQMVLTVALHGPAAVVRRYRRTPWRRAAAAASISTSDELEDFYIEIKIGGRSGGALSDGGPGGSFDVDGGSPGGSGGGGLSGGDGGGAGGNGGGGGAGGGGGGGGGD